MAETIGGQRQQPDWRQQAILAHATSWWYERQEAYQWSHSVVHGCLAGLSPRIVLLVIFVLTSSALDALFTLLHIQQGGSEANPIMALLIERGSATFVGLKMSLTSFGALILAGYQHVWLGLQGLYLLSLVYSGLLIYHGIIFFSGI
ncbi:MAG TPA: DUF5658 family protein [Candidatus Tectomicrobia bacterium]|jgi:hypothetical protein